jgi:hypothetical protein
LRDSHALQFEGQDSEPASMTANPNHPAPAIANKVENKKLGEQILAIQEVLERIPLDELPTILQDLRRMRCEWEGADAYEYSQAEVEAFERLISEFVTTVGAAQISDCDSAVELPIEMTRFGGQPYAESEDEWPACPHCGLSLNFVGVQLVFISGR